MKGLVFRTRMLPLRPEAQFRCQQAGTVCAGYPPLWSPGSCRNGSLCQLWITRSDPNWGQQGYWAGSSVVGREILPPQELCVDKLGVKRPAVGVFIPLVRQRFDLIVPLRLENESSSALNIYSSRTHGFTGEDIARAEVFGEQSAKTLRLELRLSRLQEAKDNLDAAMKNRTATDIAVGVIMAQNRCSQEAAMTVLRKASNSRNEKLRDAAAGVIDSVAPSTGLRTHFDE